MKKLFIIMVSFIAISNIAFAQTSNSTSATQKTTATLTAVCTISGQNVNFGQISLPVGGQSTTSSMNVQCTKGSSYTIGLAYGGIYGQGVNANETLILAYTTTQKSYDVNPGTVNCWWTNTGSTASFTYIYQQSFQSSCASTITHQFNTSYSYGKMNGVISGDSIAYVIQVPNNPSEVWNTGNYSYTSTGTGSNQSIPVVATLVPAQTQDKYPAADSYLDTVIATITY